MSTGERIKRWISKNKTPLRTGVCGLVLAVLGSLVLAPKLKDVCIPVGCQELNIAVLISLAAGLIMIVVALCWHTRGSWIAPSILVILLGLFVFGSYVHLAFVREVITGQEAQTVLTAVGIVLAGFAVLAAIFGIFFTRKVEKLVDIEKRVNDVSTLTVTAAELAFVALPDFTESQQIPDNSREVLRDITDDIFGQDRTLFNFLDERGNGMRLRYARGLSLFSEGKYDEAREILNEVLEKAKKGKIKSIVLHRLGIAYRQDQFYRKSIECFLNLAKNNRGDQYFADIAKIGTAITLRAMWVDNSSDESWEKLSDKKKKKLWGDLDNVFGNSIIGDANAIKKWALTLVADIWNSQPQNPLVCGYLAKIYREDSVDDKEAILAELTDEKVDTDTVIENATQTVIDYVSYTFHEKSLNIKANYFSALGLCYYYRNSIELARKAWKRAINVAQYYMNIRKKAQIYSEIREKEISVQEFIDEINDSFLSRINNATG